MVDFHVLIFSIKLPISPVQQVDELVTGLATFVYIIPRFFRNHFLYFCGKVFERIPRALLALLLISCAILHVLFLSLLSQFFFFQHFDFLGFFLFGENLFLNSLVVVHFFLHDVVLNPLHLCEQSILFVDSLFNQDIVLTQLFRQF